MRVELGSVNKFTARSNCQEIAVTITTKKNPPPVNGIRFGVKLKTELFKKLDIVGSFQPIGFSGGDMPRSQFKVEWKDRSEGFDWEKSRNKIKLQDVDLIEYIKGSNESEKIKKIFTNFNDNHQLILPANMNITILLPFKIEPLANFWLPSSSFLFGESISYTANNQLAVEYYAFVDVDRLGTVFKKPKIDKNKVLLKYVGSAQFKPPFGKILGSYQHEFGPLAPNDKIIDPDTGMYKGGKLSKGTRDLGGAFSIMKALRSNKLYIPITVKFEGLYAIDVNEDIRDQIAIKIQCDLSRCNFPEDFQHNEKRSNGLGVLEVPRIDIHLRYETVNTQTNEVHLDSYRLLTGFDLDNAVYDIKDMQYDPMTKTCTWAPDMHSICEPFRLIKVMHDYQTPCTPCKDNIIGVSLRFDITVGNRNHCVVYPIETACSITG